MQAWTAHFVAAFQSPLDKLSLAALWHSATFFMKFAEKDLSTS